MSERNSRRTIVGIVVSNKMDKSIVVNVEESRRHPLYGKTQKVSKKYMAHDEKQRMCNRR